MDSFYFVTVAYGNGPLLLALLNSIKKHLQMPAEVIVWDNGGCREAFTNWQNEGNHGLLKARYLSVEKNLGFAQAVNRAVDVIAKENPGQRVPFIVINPDAEIATPITEEIIQELSRHQGLIGLQVFDDPDKKIRQASARSFPSPWAAIAGREGLLTRYFPNNPWSRKYLGEILRAGETRTVDWVSGSAFLTDTEVWKRLKGYDESFFLYVEDVDLGRKAKLAAVPVLYCQRIDVIHRIRGSSPRLWKSDYYHHLGMWIYYVKWASPLTFIFGPVVFIAIWLRFLFRRVVSP